MDDQAAAGEGGPGSPPEPARADPIAGGLVTETLAYDGGRQVTAYVPPDPPEAVVFAGDGQGISQWGGFLEAAGVPSTMIVGVASHGAALWQGEFPLMVAWAFGHGSTAVHPARGR